MASKLNLQKGVFDAVRIRFPAPPAGPQAGPHLVLIGPGEVKLAAQVLVEGESHLVPALNGGCDDLPYSCRSKAAPVQQGEPRAQRERSGAAAGSASAVYVNFLLAGLNSPGRLGRPSSTKGRPSHSALVTLTLLNSGEPTPQAGLLTGHRVCLEEGHPD